MGSQKTFAVRLVAAKVNQQFGSISGTKANIFAPGGRVRFLAVAGMYRANFLKWQKISLKIVMFSVVGEEIHL